MRCLRLVVLSLVVLIAVVAGPSRSESRPTDPTARGLDVFVHGPVSAPSGGVLPLSLEALGFPTITTTVPLGAATIEAAWDPEKLGSKDVEAPPSVSATTNGEGRATLSIPVPRGEPNQLTLLVSVRAGGKQRVREIAITRVASDRISLFVSESRVVPGSEISAWALVEKADGGAAIVEAPIELELLEGGVSRFSARATSDRAGSAMFRVPIPRAVAPGLEWTLTARAVGPTASATTVAKQMLQAREETPGKPQFSVRFDEGSVRPGDEAHYRIRLRDASNEAVANHEIFVWTGAKGVEPPTGDLDFQKAAKRMTTDGAGEIVAPLRTPSTIALKGTTMSVVARTEMEGVVLADHAGVDVGKRRGHVEVLPEANVIVPGIEQRVLLRLEGDDAEPIVGSFTVEGDGLKANVTTDAHGEAEISWKVPKGIGAKRDVGPCAGGVAAALVVRAASDGDAGKTSKTAFDGALVGRDGLPVCVAIDRDADVLLRPEHTVVRAGEELKLDILGQNHRVFSLVAESDRGSEATSQWIEHGQDAAVVKIPATARGIYRLSVAAPRPSDPALLSATRVLVVPRVLPKVTAKVIGGRAAPGGKVIVEATIVDENGRGLEGSMALAMIDKLGGGSLSGLVSLDTRADLCSDIESGSDRCDELLLGDTKADPARRALLASLAVKPDAPILDPGKSLKADVNATFGAVVKSLEGAVWQASSTPEELVDVRRKEGGKFVFNPELMTLVTDAMDKPPEMPGGEPISLGDLLAIDPQVTYDNVAHRLTRLKLFDVLKALRDYRIQNQIDLAEPVFKEPNALLRRLVHDGQLTRSQLLDPWGGTLEFYKAGSEVMPFMTVAKGFELRSPGPDGKLGTGDDVRDPFERVLKSGSAYASAVDEDRLVDARYDMRVADATVESWSTMLREMTGTELGGLGLSGIGEGGGGSGEGIGLGSVGTIGHGSGRGTYATSRGIAYFSPPKRTDSSGHIRFEVPLGDVETTWEIAVVGLPDQARPAVATVDVPITLPLSAKVFAGAAWIVGDSVDATITLRNRTDAPFEAALDITPSGAVALANANDAKLHVSIAKHGASTVRVRTIAKSVGEAKLVVKTSAPGVAEDVLTHAIDVKPAGEPTRVAHATWVEGQVDLGPYLERRALVPLDAGHITIERGESPALEAAAASIDPDDMVSEEALADAIDLENLVHGFAIARGGDRDPLAVRSAKMQDFAMGKLAALHVTRERDWVTPARAGRNERMPIETQCPGDNGEALPLWVAANGLDAEPAADAGSVRACWTTYVAETLNRLSTSEDPASIARGVLALVRRPHRQDDAHLLATRLKKLVELTPDGTLQLSTPTAATRSLVYAALFASTKESDARTRAVLLRWLLVQRDAAGSFGSTAATRAVVQVLTSSGFGPRTPSNATVLVRTSTSMEGPLDEREVKLSADGLARVELPNGVRRLFIESPVVPGSVGVFARLERTYLRPFTVAPQQIGAPVSLEVKWPDAKRGNVANLHVALRRTGPLWSPVEVKIPLPPGVMLADSIAGARQVQGAVYFRATPTDMESNTLIPLRFTLAGQVTVAEPTVTSIETQAPTAYDRARPLTIDP